MIIIIRYMHDIEMENTAKYEVCVCFGIQRGFYMDNKHILCLGM